MNLQDTIILHRVPKHKNFNFTSLEQKSEMKICVLDTETTGLNKDDEIIEFGYQIISCDLDGNMFDVIDEDSLFNEPTKGISRDIENITGINFDMVKGHKIDWVALAEKLSDVDFFIAHNAGFDRPFCERYSDIFKEKPWGCSQIGFDYLEEFKLSKNNLEYLLWKVSKSFYDAHRALDDVQALSLLLSARAGERTILSGVVEDAKQSFYIVQATGAPFSTKDELKGLQMRWNQDARVWEKSITESNLEAFKQSLMDIHPSIYPKALQKRRFSND